MLFISLEQVEHHHTIFSEKVQIDEYRVEHQNMNKRNKVLCNHTNLIQTIHVNMCLYIVANIMIKTRNMNQTIYEYNTLPIIKSIFNEKTHVVVAHNKLTA